MCGIIAIVRRPPTRSTPSLAEISTLLDRATQDFAVGDAAALRLAGESLAAVNELLGAVPGAVA